MCRFGSRTIDDSIIGSPASAGHPTGLIIGSPTSEDMGHPALGYHDACRLKRLPPGTPDTTKATKRLV
jgi:hypothetical protein